MTDPRMTTTDAPVTVEQDPYFATIEPWEYENQRELGLLYNHRPDDSLQFNRGHMRQAIQHGRRLAGVATGPAKVEQSTGWTPHQDYAGEPMKEGEFRDPPSTVEQEAQSLEALSDWLLANDHDMALPDSVAHDPRDVAATLRRLAALASAPAENEVEEAARRMYEDRPYKIDSAHQAQVTGLPMGAAVRWDDLTKAGYDMSEWYRLARAALARPRAAVGEREA